MRFAAALWGGTLLVLCGGCGYIGPVVPPSPMIPAAVTDLAVTEVGEQLEITFTPPSRTTDSAEIKRFTSFDLHVNDQKYDVPVSMKPVHFAIPATDWVGKDITVELRTSGKSERHFSAWSNPVKLKVIPPLKAPDVTITATVQGYSLSWPDEGAGVQYDVLRKGATESKFVQIGTSDVAHYVDGTAQWGTPYRYEVMAHTATAESPIATTKEVNVPDTFPPAVPVGVAGATTADSVELSWDRNTESDLKGYYVYRAGDDGKFVKVGELTVLPAYSDHAVEHGKTYQYEVSAIDQSNNESARSAPVSIAFP